MSMLNADSSLSPERYLACPSGDFEADNEPEGANCCAVSSFPPAPNEKALKFCHIFPDESCCFPAQDAEIEEYYFTLLDSGDICAKQSSQAKDALRRIFCFGCDPKSSEAYASIPEGGGTMIKVCKDLAYEAHPVYFDDCGMVLVAERGCVDCGDDTIIPSRQWFFCGENQVSLANIKLQLAFGWGVGATYAEAGDVEFDDDADGASCWDVTSTLGDAGLDAYFPNTANTDTLADIGVIGCALGVSASANSPMNDYSCSAPYKFLNDNSGGKPPYFDGSYHDFMVVLQDCSDERDDGTRAVGCDGPETNVCFTGGASQTGMGATAVVLPVILTLRFIRSAFGQ